jgi:WD40 repeat protein
MSRSRIVLLAAATFVAAAAVSMILIQRQRPRPREDVAVKPPAAPSQQQGKFATPTTPATSPADAITPAPTTPTTPATPPAGTVVLAPTSPPANEDGVALLPQVKPPAPVAENATDAATFVAFAPNGRLLVARASGRLQFIDLATGQRQAIEMKLPSPRAVALAPAGDRIAVANAESTDVWHVASSHRTRLAGGDVTALRFGRSGQLYTGHAGGELKVWASPNWTSSTTLRPNVGGVTQIVESPSSAHVAVIGASGGVAVCDVGERSVKQRLGAEQAWTAVAFAPDGRTLAAAGPGGIAMWDTMLWQPRPAPGGADAATHVDFWRGGTVLVTAGADGAIRIYDLATRQLLTTLSGKGRIASLDLADDGRTIAAITADGLVIWDATMRAARHLDARP